jgi:hypothetical protein
MNVRLLTALLVTALNCVMLSVCGLVDSANIDQLDRPDLIPITFDLQYDPGRINERSRYVIQVRVLESGQLKFMNSQAYPVITAGHPKTVNVILRAVRK